MTQISRVDKKTVAGVSLLKALIPSLFAIGDIRRYWSATAVSAIGDGISLTAVPATAVIFLHASAGQIGILTALTWLPNVLFSLQMGAWVDRRGRRRELMIAADLTRFIILISVPLAAAWQLLTLDRLYFVAFAAASAGALFNVCSISVFSSIVPASRIVEGQALDAGARTMAALVGPGLGGILIQIVMAPVAVAADAASFLISAVLLSRVKSAPDAGERRDAGLFLLDGLRYIFRTPAIRGILCLTASANLVGAMFITILLLYMTQELDVPAGSFGLVLGIAGLGSLLGASATPAIGRRLPFGWILGLGSVLGEWPLLIVAAASGSTTMKLALLGAAALLSGFGGAMRNIGVGTVFLTTVPPAMRSTARGAYQAISFGARPLGALLAGAAAGPLGLRATMWLIAAGGALCFLWVAVAPLRQFARPWANTPGT